MKNTLIKMKEAGSLWYHHDADHMAASVSYYSLFGLVPFILLTLAVSSFIFGREEVALYLVEVGSLLGGDTVMLLTGAINNLESLAGRFSVPIMGIVFFSGMTIVMINTFTGGLMHLWGVPHRGFKGWLNKSFRSGCFVFLIQLAVLAMLMMQLMVSWLPAASQGLLSVVGIVFNFIVIAFLISLAYGILLWDSPSWRARWQGALVACVLFYIAKLLVAAYVAVTPFPGLFGTAGLLVVLLIWVYATVSILYFGAALAKVLDKS